MSCIPFKIILMPTCIIVNIISKIIILLNINLHHPYYLLYPCSLSTASHVKLLCVFSDPVQPPLYICIIHTNNLQ